MAAALQSSTIALESCIMQATTKKDNKFFPPYDYPQNNASSSTGSHKKVSTPTESTLTQEPTHNSFQQSAPSYLVLARNIATHPSTYHSILLKRKTNKSPHTTNTCYDHTKSLAFDHRNGIKRPGQGTTTTPC
jgi:hypothetical protein